MRLSLCRSAKAATSGPRITVPSSFISSESTPTGGRPASRQRSMQASVWPERISTPPSRATSGNTWPGRTKSAAPLLPLASARTVLVRSSAEMPVVSPWRTSTVMVKAVPSGASLAATIGSRCSRRASGADSGAQTMPEVWRMMKAIFSGVQSEAATNRSPSFSRSSSSVTTTISPRAKAAMTASTRSKLSITKEPSPDLLLEWPSRRLADLTPVTQIVICSDAGLHRLADGDRADPDAWVVAALGHHLGLVAIAVDGLARRQDRRGGLHGKAHHHRLAGRDAAEDAARIVGQEPRLAVVAHAHLVGIVLAAQRSSTKARADLDALHGVDAHDGAGELTVELAVDRRTQPRRHAFGHHLDDGADRGALLAHAVEIVGEARRSLGIGAEERIALDLGPIPGRAVDFLVAYLNERAAHGKPRHDLARNRAARDPHRGFARRGAPAAAIVLQAVFDVVGVAGVTRPVGVLDRRIVLGALVDVFDQQRNRRAGRDLAAGRLVGEHTGEDFDGIGLLALGGEARLPGPALVEIGLDVGLGQRNARRAAVDHAADGRPMALAERRDAKQMAERIERPAGSACGA